MPNMNEQKNQFEQLCLNEVGASPAPVVHIQTPGGSNTAQLLLDAFRFGLMNMQRSARDRLGPDVPVILGGGINAPGGRTLWVAAVFEGEQISGINDRLRSLIEAGKSCKHIRIYMTARGAYLAHSDFNPVLINPSDGEEALLLGEPLQVSRLLYTDLDHGEDLSSGEQELVHQLQEYLAAPANQGVQLQSLAPSSPPAQQKALSKPSGIPFEEIAQRIESLGGIYTSDTLRRYHAAMNALPDRNFVLLKGIPGAGKTLLARLYAQAILGDTFSKRFVHIPVRPDWSSPSDLQGHYRSSPPGYQRTPFLNALLLASEDPEQPVFVLLDEMNLSRPEHYLSDLLSVMDSNENIKLHHEENFKGVPGSIPWPKNLYITGTVSTSTTAIPVSPTILNRVDIVDVSDVDVGKYLHALVRQRVLFPLLAASLAITLQKLHEALAPHGLHPGYRLINEIVRYIIFCEAQNLLTSQEALDEQLSHRVLPQILNSGLPTETITALQLCLASYEKSSALLSTAT